MEQYRLEWFTNNGRPFFLNNPRLDKPFNMKVYDVTLTNDTINVNGWKMKLYHVSKGYAYHLYKTRINVTNWFFTINYFHQTFIAFAHDICEHVIKYGKRN